LKRATNLDIIDIVSKGLRKAAMTGNNGMQKRKQQRKATTAW